MESARDSPGAATRHAWLPDVVLAVGAVGLAAGIVNMFVVDDRTNAVWFLGSAVTLGSAAVVRRRRPAHPLVIWFALLGACLPWQYLAQDVLAWSIRQDSSPWATASVNIAWRIAVAISIAAAMRLFVRFPDGRTPGRLEHRAIRLGDIVLLVTSATLVTTPIVASPEFILGDPVNNPLRIPGIAIDVGVVRAILDLANVVVLVGLILVVRRYRRSAPPDRRRIRWLLLPLVAGVFSLFAELLLDLGHGGALAGLVASSALGVGVAFGIVRPDGVDVDEVLRRSVVWGLLWLGIAASYVAASAAFGVTIGRRGSMGWAVTTTVLAMLALQPVRAAVERVANRRLFGAPPDPRRAVARLGDSLAGTYDLETLLPEIATALEEGLGVEWARVRLTPGSEPVDRSPAFVVPIVLDGDELGIVECGPRPNGPLDEDDQAIVATFAGQAALAVRNVRLTTQLQDRTAELAASRARLVRAQEAERRRIEQNIHDGVQQDLVALIGQTGIIQRRLPRDDPAASTLVEQLDQLRDGLQRLLSELRELAAGIHPSVLRDQGLLAAVEALAARHPIQVHVRADPDLRDLRLPVEVEGAGYYTVAESLANALKHAGAHELGVTLTRSNGSVSICVEDDGVGFEPRRADGNGLANLAERVAALDGLLVVDSQPGHGTRISATLPISEPG